MGVGDKLFAIPLEAFTIDLHDHTIILDMDKEMVKKAPGFDKNHLPDDAQYETGWLLDI